MKHFIKASAKRMMLALLCVVMTFSSLCIPAFAWTSNEGVKCTSQYGDLYVGADGKYYYHAAEIKFIQYDSDGNISLHSYTGSHPRTKMGMKDADGLHYVYCVESGVDFFTGDDYVSESGDNSRYFKNLPMEAQFGIMTALVYGYHDGKTVPVSGANEDDYAIATQTIIWEFQQQLRTAPDKIADNNGIAWDTYYDSIKGRPAEACYNWILQQMANHYVIPSFCAKNAGSADTYTLKYDPSTKNYTLTVTDDNNVLSDLSFSGASGITVSKSGNQYTFTSDHMIEDAVLLTGKKNINLDCDDMLIWGCPGKQTMVTGAADPVRFYVNIKTETYGICKIVKSSEDGLVSGIRFSITGNGVDKSVTTDDSGTISTQLLPGTYTVTEDAPEKYVQPESQTVIVTSGQTASVEFGNVLKKWTLSVSKRDAETGTVPQGDAALCGAEFGIYQNGTLVDTYTTDESGNFTTKEYVCGTGWELREITPPVGYLLKKDYTALGTAAGNFTAELNPLTDTESETVIKGTISIIKHTDDGTTKIETPEVGAAFEVYLKSAGSYDKAKTAERDLLICDQNGYAHSKDLPYGTYIVKQTKGWDGKELIAPFEVEITENSKDYKYLINNATFSSYVKIVKKDAETGKTIPVAGTSFQIFDPSGKPVAMTMTYPTVVTIDTFKTNSEGYLVTPQSLPYGKGYSIVETNAPEGYVLNKTPVKFDVTEANATKESAVTVVLVEKPDLAQKGVIKIQKTGEVFASVIENDGAYQPVYKDAGLSDAVFEIYADEDVTTPDGSLRYAKDTLVDTVTTGKDGLGTSKELYLGKYRVVETKAPFGTVIDRTVQTAVLKYAGQEISVTSTSLSQNNDRQKLKIELTKALEKDEKIGLGGKSELKNVSFGLYADEDLTAADGKVIPKDGLIETVSVSKNGSVSFRTDLPFGHYYVKEMATDEHYLISDSKYAFTFEYATQEDAVVVVKPNGDKAIDNGFIRGSVTTTKYDKDYPDHKLSGAVFEIFRDSNGNKQYDDGIDVLIDEMSETAPGVYEKDKLIYGGYFLFEKTAPEGYVQDTGYHYFEIIKDGETVSVSNDGGTGFANSVIKGSVSTTKIDSAYPDHKLTGAVFEVYRDVDQDGKYTEGTDVLIGTLSETETGVYSMKDLQYGSYLLHEKAAPSGYQLDSGYYAFRIAEDGKTVTVSNNAGIGFTDQAIPSVPQTGDNSNVGFWIGLGAVALGGVVALLILRKKKKKDDDE